LSTLDVGTVLSVGTYAIQLRGRILTCKTVR
jgi:hypothetical protein